MAFVARKVTREEMNRICDLTDKESWDVATYRGESDSTLAVTRVVSDDEEQELLLLLPMLRDDPATRYLFCTPDGCVYLQEAGYCQFLILNVSRALDGQLEYVKNKIRQAFRVGGSLLGGSTDTLIINAVPDAQFIGVNGGAM